MKQFSPVELGRDHTSSLSIRWVDGEAHLYRGEAPARSGPIEPFTLEMHLTKHILKLRALYQDAVAAKLPDDLAHKHNKELRALLQEAAGKVPDRLAKQIVQTLDKQAAEAGYQE